MDNLFVVQELIDYYKYMKSDLYIVTVDAEKCFDKLWLADTINELYKMDIDMTEINLIKEMNSNIKAIVRTPHGDTEPITIKTAVRQGTIFGPTLCGVETDKVNCVEGFSCTMIEDELGIQNLIYVDDIIVLGNKSRIKQVEGSLIQMEVQKKFSFNKEKSAILHMTFNKRKEEKERVTVTVRQGELKQVNEIKYLGNEII